MRSSTAEVSVLLASFGSHPQHVRGVFRYAREKNWRLVLDSHYDGHQPIDWPGSGVIAIHALNRSLPKAALTRSFPLVSIAHECALVGGTHLSVNHHAVGTLAAQHLWDRGYRTFAYAPLVHDSFDQAREGGFRQYLRAKGVSGVIALPPLYNKTNGTLRADWENRRKTVTSVLVTLPKSTAIFAYNNSIATDLMQICQEVGLRVPQEIALIGVDEDPGMGELLSPSLSSIDIDYARVGYEAAAELDRRMNHGTEAASLFLLPQGVVARASTGTPAADDARLQDALAFIQGHYANPSLGVTDVAAALKISRRSIERLFREKRQTTISECIAMTRIQEAARILRSEDRSRVIEVATRVGFSTQTHFFRRFRRQFGVSPKTYMRQAEPTRPLLCAL